MKLFISWSGKLSKEVGKALKNWLNDSVFKTENLHIFYSEEDIGAGLDWLHVIKEELLSSDCALIILTQDNIDAPWLNFEAGSIAISGKDDRRTIPLFIDTDTGSTRSPLRHFQGATLSKSDIRKLIEDIKEFGGFSSPSHIEDSLDRLYLELIKKVEESRAAISGEYLYNNFRIYPEYVKGIKKGKVFIGVPMASADDKEYAEYKDCALRVKQALIDYTGAKEVYCPSESIPDRGKFEGYKKAIIKDFQILKESEHYVFIYPKNINSSILVEMGYAIALSKNTTIFAKNKKDLPFMLKKADTVIHNLEIYEYVETDDIIDIIKKEGDALLIRSGDNDHNR